MHYIELIFVKAWAEIKSEASRAYIGFLWWFIEPLLYMAAFYLIFGIGLRQGGENYLFFLLCGLVPWKWFSSTLNSGSKSITANVGLINQVYLPKYIFPLVVVAINTFKFMMVFPILLIFLWFSEFEPSATWLALIPIILCQFFLIIACASLLASLVPYLPDLRYVIENGMLLLMFLSGVFFSIEEMESGVRDILMLNPVALLLNSYRNVLLNGESFIWLDLIRVSLFSVIIGLVSWYILKKIDRKVIKEI